MTSAVSAVTTVQPVTKNVVLTDTVTSLEMYVIEDTMDSLMIMTNNCFGSKILYCSIASHSWHSTSYNFFRTRTL